MTDAWALCARPVDQVELVSTGADGNVIAAAWATAEPGVVFYDFVTTYDPAAVKAWAESRQR